MKFNILIVIFLYILYSQDSYVLAQSAFGDDDDISISSSNEITPENYHLYRQNHSISDTEAYQEPRAVVLEFVKEYRPDLVKELPNMGIVDPDTVNNENILEGEPTYFEDDAHLNIGVAKRTPTVTSKTNSTENSTLKEPPKDRDWIIPGNCACSDNNSCTQDVCDYLGICHSYEIQCDDKDYCTESFCDPKIGCVHRPLQCVQKNDLGPCLEFSCVNPLLGCEILINPCHDSNECTFDYCDPAFGGCQHTNITCDDQNPCTIDECHPEIGCIYTPIQCETTNDPCKIPFCGQNGCTFLENKCSDGNHCTKDICNGTCIHEPIENCNTENSIIRSPYLPRNDIIIVNIDDFISTPSPPNNNINNNSSVSN